MLAAKNNDLFFDILGSRMPVNEATVGGGGGGALFFATRFEPLAPSDPVPC